MNLFQLGRKRLPTLDILVSGFRKSLTGIGRRGGKGREGKGRDGKEGVTYIHKSSGINDTSKRIRYVIKRSLINILGSLISK